MYVLVLTIFTWNMQAYCFYNWQQMTESEQAAFKPSLFIKIFIGYIYFMQGVYLSLISVVVYLFPVFPSPEVLSNFSIAALPFSFKYITAPIVQKFTVHSYGRRKFWISLSLFVTSVLTFPLAAIASDQEQYMTTIGLMTVITLFISMGDVGIDAAAVIELEDPVLAGYLQAGMQPLGGVIGSFLIVKANNPTFWSFIGIQGALCSTQTLLNIIAVMGFIFALIVHFCYKERVPDDQKEERSPDIKTIGKYYLHFINPKYALCRHVIYYLFVFQGIKFFTNTFSIQAIYRGFPKQRAADMSNVFVIVGIFVNTILSKIVTKENTYRFITYFYFIELIAYSILFAAEVFDQNVVFCTIFFIQIMAYMKFLMHSTLTNSFGHSQFAGLCLTTLASFVNLGSNSWLQLKMNGIFGYTASVRGGLIYAWIVALFLQRFMGWIRKGEPEAKMHETDHKQN